MPIHISRLTIHFQNYFSARHKADKFYGMKTVEVRTLIDAPAERCFDLARSADFHVKSTKSTSEKIVGGVATGLMKLSDVIEFEASHFGITQRLSARIVAFDRPAHVRDSQVRGVFQHFDHDHFFESVPGGTLMRDIFRFRCPLGLIGKLADPIVARHLRLFLQARGLELKRAAETEEWRAYV